MPYSSIADFMNAMAEGIRETNPIYAAKQKQLQQQQFEAQQAQAASDRQLQNELALRSAPMTQYEQQNINLQKQELQDREDNARGEAIRQGYIKTSPNPDDLVLPSQKPIPPGNVSGSSLNPDGQAQATPSVGPQNPAMGNGAPGLGGKNLPLGNPYQVLMGGGQGSLPPTSNSASQGQTGALGQASIGSVTPSQSGLGASTGDSGPRPPATPASLGAGSQPNAPSNTSAAPSSPPVPRSDAYYASMGIKRDPNGMYYRWSTPDEINDAKKNDALNNANVATQARIQATENYIQTLGPKADPSYIESLRRQAALPGSEEPSVDQQMARDYYNAVQSGDKVKADAALDAISSINNAKREGEGGGKTIPYVTTDPKSGQQVIHMLGDQDQIPPNSQRLETTPENKPTQWVYEDPNTHQRTVLNIGAGQSPPDGAVPFQSYTASTTEKTNANNKTNQAAINEATAAKNAYNEAADYVKMENGQGDLALIMDVMGAVKPESIGKLRFNQGEQQFVINDPRSSLDALQAKINGIKRGDLLGTDERQHYLQLLGVVAHAKAREAGLEPYEPQQTTSGPQTGNVSQQTALSAPPQMPKPLVKGQTIDKVTAQKYVDAYKDVAAARQAMLNDNWKIPAKF